MAGSLCDVNYVDFFYLATSDRCLPVQFFPLHVENEFYCFFDVGKCFLPRFAQTDRSRGLNALDGGPALFLWLGHCHIFHNHIVDHVDYTGFLAVIWAVRRAAIGMNSVPPTVPASAYNASFHWGINAVETGNNM